MHNHLLKHFLNSKQLMVQTGNNITIKDDILQKITIEHLYHVIRKTSSELDQKIKRLRTVSTIDKSRYNDLKKLLPYFVCGIFNPPYRRAENFAWIQHLVLDFDHLRQKGIEPEGLKEKLKHDTRAELIFVSPGGDGLKVMFRLSEKCFDRARFSLFYKVFARTFAEHNNLEQVIDPRTSDVTRACFLAADNHAYFNPDPDPVLMVNYVDYDNPLEVKLISDQINSMEKEEKSMIANVDIPARASPDKLILEQIREKLNPGKNRQREKQIHVPAELEKAVDIVRENLADLGITLEATRDIHYGKKFTFSLGLRKSEINLFHGKRGYSVVISPKAGTDKELADVCAALMQDIFLPGNTP